MKLDNYLNKNITVTQIKSGSKLTKKQAQNIIGLGLRGIGSSKQVKVDNSILGMIRKIQQIIKIS
jgi:large subunit ribosomal protein L30